MAIFIAVRSTDSSVRKMRETAKLCRPSRAGYSMQRSQYGLPTEPCDQICNWRRLDDRGYYSTFGGGCQGFGGKFTGASFCRGLPRRMPGSAPRPPHSTLSPYPSSSGSRTVNVAPWPGALSTPTLPPQRSTMRLTSARPRPLPSVAWAVSP